jgi:hypothetical protein
MVHFNKNFTSGYFLTLPSPIPTHFLHRSFHMPERRYGVLFGDDPHNPIPGLMESFLSPRDGRQPWLHSWKKKIVHRDHHS